MDDFRISTSTDGPAAVVHLEGELDAATAPLLDEHLRRLDTAQPVPAELVLDLGDLAFIDSSGLSVLVAAHKRLRGRDGSFVIANPSMATRRIFSISGLDKVLAIRE